MSAIERLVWSAICKAASDHRQEGLILSRESREALRAAASRVGKLFEDTGRLPEAVKDEIMRCATRIQS